MHPSVHTAGAAFVAKWYDAFFKEPERIQMMTRPFLAASSSTTSSPSQLLPNLSPPRITPSSPTTTTTSPATATATAVYIPKAPTIDVREAIDMILFGLHHTASSEDGFAAADSLLNIALTVFRSGNNASSNALPLADAVAAYVAARSMSILPPAKWRYLVSCLHFRAKFASTRAGSTGPSLDAVTAEARRALPLGNWSADVEKIIEARKKVATSSGVDVKASAAMHAFYAAVMEGEKRIVAIENPAAVAAAAVAATESATATMSSSRSSLPKLKTPQIYQAQQLYNNNNSSNSMMMIEGGSFNSPNTAHADIGSPNKDSSSSGDVDGEVEVVGNNKNVPSWGEATAPASSTPKKSFVARLLGW